MAIAKVVKAGQTLASLEAMRDEIASDLDVCTQMRDKAALYMRLSDVLARIDELSPKEAVGDTIDEITARRDARRAGPAARANRAKRSG